MNEPLYRSVAIALLPLSLWACSAPAPAPVDSRHPAHPAAASAPMSRLQVLQTYEDFSAQERRSDPQSREPTEEQKQTVPPEGKSDDHEH